MANAEREAEALMEQVQKELRAAPEWIRNEYEGMFEQIRDKAQGKNANRPEKTLQCLEYVASKILEARQRMLPKKRKKRKKK